MIALPSTAANPSQKMSKPLRTCTKCGLETWTQEDLDKFCNNRESKYGKRNLCLNCNKDYLKAYTPKPPKPKPTYLRICKDCGLEAHTEEDLELFRFHRHRPHSKDNWCLDCFNEWQKEKEYVKKARAKQKEEMIASFEKPLKCFFCGGLITVMTGKTWKSFVGHSLDGNHNNFNPENKVPTHRGCHSSWHSSYPENRNNKKEGEGLNPD